MGDLCHVGDWRIQTNEEPVANGPMTELILERNKHVEIQIYKGSFTRPCEKSSLPLPRYHHHLSPKHVASSQPFIHPNPRPHNPTHPVAIQTWPPDITRPRPATSPTASPARFRPYIGESYFILHNSAVTDAPGFQYITGEMPTMAAYEGCPVEYRFDAFFVVDCGNADWSVLCCLWVMAGCKLPRFLSPSLPFN
jgi:hypothetical protein